MSKLNQRETNTHFKHNTVLHMRQRSPIGRCDDRLSSHWRSETEDDIFHISLLYK